MSLWIDDLVTIAVREDALAREKACKVALQSGRQGVMAVRDTSTGRWSYTVTDAVPYGSIHDYPHGRTAPA